MITVKHFTKLNPDVLSKVAGFFFFYIISNILPGSEHHRINRVFNLLEYTTNAYPNSTLFFGLSGYVFVTAGIPILLINLVEKKKAKFSIFSRSIVFGFSLSILLTSLLGILEMAICKLFSFWLIYLILPLLFFILFTFTLIHELRRKQSVKK